VDRRRAGPPLDLSALALSDARAMKSTSGSTDTGRSDGLQAQGQSSEGGREEIAERAAHSAHNSQEGRNRKKTMRATSMAAIDSTQHLYY